MKKFWWLIVVGILAYYMSDPIRKAKMLQFLSGLPLIGPMMIKWFPVSSAPTNQTRPDQNLTN